jgi:hypothetical protein
MVVTSALATRRIRRERRVLTPPGKAESRDVVFDDHRVNRGLLF